MRGSSGHSPGAHSSAGAYDAVLSAELSRWARRAERFSAVARPRAVHALRVWLARVTPEAADARVQPDFVILGAQRSGTTSMYDTLTAHPSVRRALTKETHFFTLGYRPDARHYQAWFPRQSELAGGCITGEATPAYLFHPLAAGRMARALPRTRFIVLLREPASRAMSHYHQSVRRGQEALPLMDALRAEDARLTEAVARHGQGAGLAFYAHSYAARGRYAEQLERFFAVIEHDRFLILHSEDYFDHPLRVVRAVCRFLGVNPDQAPAPSGPTNARTAHTAPVDPRARRYLADYFEPHNARLAALLGEDFGWSGAR